jgi:hypothetical protein
MVLKPSMMAAATMARAPRRTLAMLRGLAPLSSPKSRRPQRMPTRELVFQKGKGDGEADVANGEDGEGVGDGPEHAGEDGVEDEVLVAARSAKT